VANTDAYALQRSDLNGFLFADVGVEASGMTLSVLSTLARLGVDPWQEAGRLAKLPRAAAADGLARIIAAMPASSWSLPDAAVIAARLVTLLPARGISGGASPLPRTPAKPRTIRQWAIAVTLMGALLAALVLNVTGWPGAAAPVSEAATRWSASHPTSEIPPPADRAPARK
jgi:hypothetical protein